MFKPIVAAILCLLPAAAQPGELTLDQIIQKHVDAAGGAAKLKAIQSVKASGNASLMGGQMEAPVTMIMKRPNSMRLEMSVQGKSFIQAFDGSTAWTINPFLGSNDAQKSSDDDTKTAREHTDFVEGPLVDYKTKGHTVELIGKEDVEGSPAYKLKITRKGGSVEYAYLDAATFLTIRSTSKRVQMGQDLDLESNLGNYKLVNGVMMPHSIEQKNAGKPLMQLTIEKYEVNIPADDTLFRMPEKPAAKP